MLSKVLMSLLTSLMVGSLIWVFYYCIGDEHAGIAARVSAGAVFGTRLSYDLGSSW